MPQKKPTDSKNTNNSFLNPIDTSGDKTPSKTLGPLVIYENRGSNTSDAVTNKYPTIVPDENHYYVKSKTNKVKPPQKMANEPILNQTPQKEPSDLPQYSKANRQKDVVNKTKASSPSNNDVRRPELQVPQRPEETYHHDIGANTNNGQIHGNETPEELLQLIHQYPQIINYPPGSVLEIHDLPPQKHSQFVNPNTLTPDNPNVPYIIGDHAQGRPPIISQPPGITFEHILHEITKNTNLPQHSFAGQNGLVPNHNGQQLFLPQPALHFNSQRNTSQGVLKTDRAF